MARDITDTPNRVRYTATAAQTVFTVPFPFDAAADLKVWKNGSLLVLSTHYTVAGAGGESGTLTLVSGAAQNDEILILQDMPIARIGDFPVSGPFDVESLNDQLDAMTMMMRNLETRIEQRSLRLGQTDLPETLEEIPNKSSRANRVLSFDEDGNPDTIISVESIQSLEGAIEDAFNARDQALASQSAAAASETNAANSAASAALSSASAGAASGRLEVATFAELATVFGYTSTGGRRVVASGDLIKVTSIDATYRVLASGATSFHLNYTSSSGVKLDVLPGVGGFNVRAFGAIGDGTTNDTNAINTAASASRAAGISLYLPPVPTYYLISNTIDFSNIQVIEGTDAELRGSFSGIPAAIIGGTSSTFNLARISLQVRNSLVASSAAGTHGFRLLSMSNSRLTLYARGFLNGIYFDGSSGSRVWVDNAFNIVALYNNANQVHFDLGGPTQLLGSYAVKNSFVGGSYYLGTGTPVANTGTFKLTLNGWGLVSDITVQSAEIGVDRGSVDISTYSAFVHANVDTNWTTNTIEFIDARFEGYGSWSNASPYAVNIATNTIGRIGVSVELTGSVVTADAAPYNFSVFSKEGNRSRIRIVNKTIRPQGAGVQYTPQVVTPREIIPYQTSGRCYVPGRVIYDDATGYNAPVDYFTTGVGTNGSVRAIGDGDIISGITTQSYGLIYTKQTTATSFIQLMKPQEFAVICFDASGNILSGTSPYYAVGEGFRSVLRGSVNIYEFNGNWLWLHPDVASFYIGAARWSNNGKLEDIAFSVLSGSHVTKLNATKMSPSNMVTHALPSQSFMPVGSEMTGVSTNGWRNTFHLRTSTSASAASGSSVVTVASATGVAAGDTIGIEINTEIATGLRRYHFATVSSVSGSDITIGNTLSAAVDSGRTVLVNRWVAK